MWAFFWLAFIIATQLLGSILARRRQGEGASGTPAYVFRSLRREGLRALSRPDVLMLALSHFIIVFLITVGSCNTIRHELAK
jgi:hypothetical protein